MTRDQKTYFMWLVLRNAQRIVRRCNSAGEGTRIINRAYEKMRALGIPVRLGKTQEDMKREAISMLGNMLGVRLAEINYSMVPVAGRTVTEVVEDLDEPF